MQVGDMHVGLLFAQVHTMKCMFLSFYTNNYSGKGKIMYYIIVIILLDWPWSSFELERPKGQTE